MSKLDVYHEKDDLTAFVILTDQNLEKLGVFFGHNRKEIRICHTFNILPLNITRYNCGGESAKREIRIC